VIKLNDLAIVAVVSIIISFVLSSFKILPIAIADVLSYSLLVIGVAIVYSEIIRQNRLSVFLGSVIFLFGVYFLISENFNLNIGEVVYVPLILVFGGTGLLVLYISKSTQKIFLYISIILLSAGVTLIITNSHWGIKTFFLSILPVFDFLWPIAIVFILLMFFMKVK